MSGVREIDIETFRKSRSTRMREKIADLACSFSQRGWKETDARIEDCAAIKTHVNFGRRGVTAGVGGFAVGLSYEVNGKRYEAEAVSPVKVENGEAIKIRYNPRHPEQNNSIVSEMSWATSVVKIETILMVIFLLALFAAGIMMRR